MGIGRYYLLILLLVPILISISINDVFADHETSIKPILPQELANICGPSNPDCSTSPLNENDLLVFELHASGVYSPISRIEAWIDQGNTNQSNEVFGQFQNDGSCVDTTTNCPSSITVSKISSDIHRITFDASKISAGIHNVKIDAINWIDGDPTRKRTLSGGNGYTIIIGSTQPANPIITVSSPSSDPNTTIEGNNPDLKIIVFGNVQNKISGKDLITVTFTDPLGIIVYQNDLTLDNQGSFNNEFDNPLFVRDMRDSGLYSAKFVYDAIALEFDWNYLSSVFVPENQEDGPFVLPCSMQEKGDGVSASSCNGFYENGVARAEVGINYHSGLFPIQNYEAIGFFIDEIGNQGQNIKATLDQINPGESATLIFENLIQEVVTEFKMQMLGGDLVTEEPDTIPPVVVVPNDMAIQATSSNPSPVTFSVSATDDTDGNLIPVCSPASGSNFPIGITTVTCTAIDAAGNSASKSFTITVSVVEQPCPDCEPVPGTTITIPSGASLVDNQHFSPTALIINVGDTVTWTNDDTAAHTVTSGNKDDGPDGTFDSSLFMAGATFSHTFDTPGEYEYFCMVHPWQFNGNGFIHVEGDGPSPEPDPNLYPLTITQNHASGILFQGDRVTIYGKGTPLTSIQVILYNNNNPERILQITSVQGDADWQILWIVPELEAGTWYLKAYEPSTDRSVQTDFTFSEPLPPEPIPPPSEPEFEILSLRTTQNTYRVGDTIFITGKATLGDLKTTLTLQIIKGGQLVNIAQLSLRLDGTFTHTVVAEGPQWSESGRYLVRATFGGDVEETSFVFRATEAPPSEPSEPSPDHVLVSATSDSSVPGCEETNECFIPFEARVSVGGTVTWSNDDAAAHTVTSGSASDGPDGNFDSSLFMAGSTFQVTFDSTGTFPYFCMVHPWMQGVVVVGQGGTSSTPPPRHEPVDLEVSVDQRIYDLGDLVQVRVVLEGTTKTHQVAIDVADPTGTSVVTRTVSVSPDSIEQIQFRISDNFKTGNYIVAATTQVDGKTIKDKTFFKIKSQFNQFRIVSVEVTDQQGNPSTLQKGNIGFIKVILDSNKQITTLITINLFDSELTSIGIGSVKSTLTSGTSEIIISFLIPDDTVSGDAEIFVNAFSDWPSNGGVPLTNEFSIIERIGNSNQPPPSNPPPSNPPPSNPPPQSTSISVNVSDNSFEEGETIVISGKVSTIILETPVTIQIFNGGNLIEIAQIVVAQDGSFAHTILAQGPQWQNEGDYTVRASYGEGNIAEANFEFFKNTDAVETSDFFEVNAGSSGTFDVEYIIRGGTVKDMIVDSELFALIVIIESNSDGSITVDLPRESIDAKKSDGSDDLFIILIDGIEVIYDEAITNENTRTITITFEEGDSDIKIVGTFVI